MINATNATSSVIEVAFATGLVNYEILTTLEGVNDKRPDKIARQATMPTT